MRTFTIIAALCGLLAAPAGADIIYVDINLATGANDGSSWPNALRDPDCLRDAMTVAGDVDSDLVCVAEGTYTTTGTTLSIDPPDDTTIVGGFENGDNWRTPSKSATSTIIDADLTGGGKADNLFWLSATTGVSLQRMLLRDTSGSATTDCAIFCLDADLALREVTIAACGHTGNSGAGAIVWHSLGGGVALRMLDCAVANCTGRRRGPIWIDIDELGTPDSEIEILIQDCRFEGNAGNDGSGSAFGGVMALHLQGVEAEITNCLFTGNSVESLDGGCLYVALGGLSPGEVAHLTVWHCTFTENTARKGATAVVDYYDGTIAFRHSILWGNTWGLGWSAEAEIVGAADVDMLFCDVDELGSQTFNSSTGSIDSDPQLALDYSLASTSPCIDTCPNTLPADHFDDDGDLSTTDDLPYDLGGSPRAVDGNGNDVIEPDMGCYEHQ